jgi:hypothetical protein
MSTPSDFVISAKRKLRQGDVSYNRVNSEAVMSKMAGSVNFLLDQPTPALKFEIQGFVIAGDYTSKIAMYRVRETSQVASYEVIIGSAGNLSGDLVLNVDVYDNTGTLLGPLFGETGANRILFNSNGNNAQNLAFGRDYETSSDFAINTTATTVQYGEKDILTIPAGSLLVGRISGGTRRMKYLNFSLYLVGV